MGTKDLLIVLIGLSGTIVSIFGGFLLSIGHGLNETKRAIEFEMELLHKEIIQEQEKLPSQLLYKIIDFEEKAHHYSKYLEGEYGFEYLPYTTLLDHSKIRKRFNEKKHLARKVKRLYEFIIYSPDFDTFVRWTNLDKKWRKSDELKAIHSFLSCYKTTEAYSIVLEESVFKVFTLEEKKIYSEFIKATKNQRDRLWNLSIIKPTYWNQNFYILGLVYLVGITFFGVLIPFIFESVFKSVDAKLFMIIVCVLTLVYVSGVFVRGLTSKTSRRMRRKIRRHHW